MLAVGGTEKMHRTVLSCVLRGHGPGDAAAEVSMKKMLRTQVATQIMMMVMAAGGDAG